MPNKDNMKASLKFMANAINTAINEVKPKTSTHLKYVLNKFLNVTLNPVGSKIEYKVIPVQFMGSPQGVKVKLSYRQEDITISRTIPHGKVYSITK